MTKWEKVKDKRRKKHTKKKKEVTKTNEKVGIRLNREEIKEVEKENT